MRPTMLAVLLALAPALARADEGMWLLSDPPREAIRSRYGVDLTPEWLTRVQRACVRFESGGSGSIVSGDGLVMTNHHVGSDMIAKLSTPERDLMSDGFLAARREDELRCPDLEVRVLWETREVTARVNAGVKAGMPPAQAEAARRAAIAELEREAREKTGLTCETVTLFQGGRYDLYLYKSFTDVRLVFAPEEGIAFFGGDTDNFEFPRFNLDCCFFRIYEDGRPLKTPDHLRWQPAGAKEGDPAFVLGHPGRTRRGYTADHVRFMRDTDIPLRLEWLWRGEVKWRTFAGRSARHASLAREELAGIENSRKAYTGLLAGLHDPALMARMRAAERAEREEASKSPGGDAPWQAIADAQLVAESLASDKFIFERVTRSGLLARAFQIVVLSGELAKPSGQRLPEYRDSELDSLYLSLYSPEPVHDEIEVERLTQALSALADHFSADWPTVTGMLDGLGPADRARAAVAGTSLKDPAARRALVEGGASAVAASKDPLIRMARLIEPEWRDAREDWDQRVEAVERSAYARIAALRAASGARDTYPDATFTLRLSYGSMRGIPGDGVPVFTTIAGLYDRAGARRGEPHFGLPASWVARRADLDPGTPFNFVCTADIIGGNSGSPVVNAAGEVVGLIFDGNIDSLVGDVVYDEARNRAVAVDVRGMIEAMRKVYKAEALLSELLGR
jgi:hypothetical protein